MRRERRRRVRAAVTAALLAVTVLGAGCGSDGEVAEDEPVEQVSTTRRSNNDNACEQLRIVDEIKDETTALSGALTAAVVVGADAPLVLAAANELVTHLSETAPVIAEAYAEAAAWAPASPAAAIDELAASYATGTSAVIEFLGSNASGEDIAALVRSLGAAAGVPQEEIEPGAAEEVERYITVICGIT